MRLAGGDWTAILIPALSPSTDLLNDSRGYTASQDRGLQYHPEQMENKSPWASSFWDVIIVVITLVVMAVIVWFTSGK